MAPLLLTLPSTRYYSPLTVDAIKKGQVIMVHCEAIIETIELTLKRDYRTYDENEAYIEELRAYSRSNGHPCVVLDTKVTKQDYGSSMVEFKLLHCTSKHGIKNAQDLLVPIPAEHRKYTEEDGSFKASFLQSLPVNISRMQSGLGISPYYRKPLKLVQGIDDGKTMVKVLNETYVVALQSFDLKLDFNEGDTLQVLNNLKVHKDGIDYLFKVLKENSDAGLKAQLEQKFQNAVAKELSEKTKRYQEEIAMQEAMQLAEAKKSAKTREQNAKAFGGLKENEKKLIEELFRVRHTQLVEWKVLQQAQMEVDKLEVDATQRQQAFSYLAWKNVEQQVKKAEDRAQEWQNMRESADCSKKPATDTGESSQSQSKGGKGGKGKKKQWKPLHLK